MEYNADVCHNSNEFAPGLIDHAYCQNVQRQIKTSDDHDVVSIGFERVGGYVGLLKQGSQQSGESEAAVDITEVSNDCMCVDITAMSANNEQLANEPISVAETNTDNISSRSPDKQADVLDCILKCLGVQESDKFNGSYLLVEKQKLYLLLQVCSVPGCTAEVLLESESIVGSCLKVMSKCSLGHIRRWQSSRMMYDGKGDEFSEVNIALSTAMLLSGNHFDKIARLFAFLNMPLISDTTFRDLCSVHVNPVIDSWWQSMQQTLLAKIGDKPIAISSDGRTDSPGFSAQYCLYSFVYNDYVLHAELVDKKETQLKSTNMEKEACLRGLLFLLDKIHISNFCTDAHTQIRAMMRHDERFSGIVHQFDIFHKSVKLHTKLLECANKKGNNALREFIPAIRNHFWYCAQQCMGNSQKMIDMWISILRHLTGEHVWHDGQCEHEPLPAETPTLDIESKAMTDLREIVLDKKLLNELPYYRHFMHTYKLESFHNEVLAYAPKRVSFGFEAMKARCLLAIIDHNLHQGRLDKLNKSGQVIYSRKWSKRAKRWISVTVKEPKTYNYVPYMMQAAIKHRMLAKQPYRKVKRAKSANLPANHPKRIAINLAELPSMSSRVLAQEHKTRFSYNRRTPHD